MLEWVLSSSALILLVLIVRALGKSRLSCRVRYALWLLVLVRLLIPVQLIETGWGVTAPLPESLTERSIYVLPVGREEGIPTEHSEELRDPFAADSFGYSRQSGTSFIKYADKWSVANIFRTIWLVGAGLLAAVLLLSNLRFARRLKRSRVPYDALCGGMRVYVAERLASPCLVGVFRPGVYLTPESTRSEQTLRHVLAHEETHKRHGDCFWSLLRLAALCLHWYNPLAWYAAIVSRRDGELACDEATLARLGEAESIPYGETLLALVTAKPAARDLLSVSTAMTAEKRTLRERIETIVRRPRTRGVALLLSCALLLSATVLAFSKAPASAPMTGEEAPAGQNGGLYGREIDLLPQYEWRFDLDGDGRAERLSVDETRLANSADASPVRLYDADGALLAELGDAGQAHAGWMTCALAELDSGMYLMRYMPTMFQGEANYSYSLLTVSGGQPVSHTPAEVQFSINPGAENDSAAMAEFQEQANGVWAHSRLLFTTDQEVLSHLYDADTGAAVATNGSYYAASNNETVRYRETMTRFWTVRPQSFDDLPAAQQDDVLIDAGWEPLTADELEAWKETFEWPGLDTADDARIQKLLQIGCFFTSHYDTPREIDLSEFLAYFPLREAVEDEMEFAAINARAHFKHKDEDGTVRDATLREMPVPVHRYRVSDINTALTRYAGITLDDMSTDWRSDERMIYLPEYDAFYNFTSDFGLGQFAPERGMRLGSIVRLDGKWSTLRVSGTPEQFQIVSFTGR